MQGFWERVKKQPDDGCWLWMGNRTVKGYGMLYRDGRNVRAHRLSYEMEVGPIPEGLVIDHLCLVTSCVRPDHLEAVTAQENRRRQRNCGRKPDSHCSNGHRWTTSSTRWYIYSYGKRRWCLICAEARNGRPARTQVRYATKEA